ncbi:MAG: RNA ligase (ATP) [Bifidobacteriaceae bacterium]|jgi:RNA ligase (TIGR02306 family)|nr:RNA ligase (ATP) [Bifidobacteriaceae bacterium]
MPIAEAEGRKLATVESVAAVTPIEGADAIEAAHVRGWTVVVKKGDVNPGDKVVYIEVDTALPVDDPLYAFLAQRGVKEVAGRKYHVLRTIRLRGVYSQGILFPASAYPTAFGFAELPDGTDVTGVLGLGKYEPPMPVGAGDQVGPFLTQYARKTDAERVQNLLDVWPALLEHRWVATLKIDGSSATAVRDQDGAMRVMSRNWEIGEGDNTYWNVVRRHEDLFGALKPGEALQFEIAGPGIQSNRLQLPDVRPFVFAANLAGPDGAVRRGVPIREWPEGIRKWSVPVLEEATEAGLPATAEQAIAQAEGLRWGPRNLLAEGIVWHEAEGVGLEVLDGRNIFKVVNNRYLEKTK